MKKSFQFLQVFIIVTIFATLLWKPAEAKCLNSNKKMAITAIPDSLFKIFQKSCMACHASGANQFAAAHVNFTDWDKYNPKKQADKAGAICKMISKGAMPPKNYRSSNPGTEITPKQNTDICNWATSLGSYK